MTIALIDGDKIVYSSAFAAQKKHKGGEVEVFPVQYALQNAKMTINKVLEVTGADEYYMFLTSNDRSNFRFKVATIKPYKGKRPPKPTHYQAVRDYLENYWNANIITGMEADDALAIGLTQWGAKAILCSDDKDMLQVSGRHYNITKSIFTDVDERIGWFNFFKQTLTGDSADNIPGLHRIGPVTATKLLEDAPDYFEMTNIVQAQYRTKYGDNRFYPIFKEICTLLYLLRAPDDSWEKCVHKFDEEFANEQRSIQ